MASNVRTNKVEKFKKPINFNIGMLIFVVIAIYVVICVILYMRSNPVVGYEVKMGSLSVNNVYNGIVIRDEEVVTTQDAGYVNYYARESEKVACGDLVYTVDGNGKLTEMLQSDTLGENTLSDEDLNQIKGDIVSFVKDFDPEQFSDVYGFKYDLQGTSLKLANLNILNSIDELQNGTVAYGVKLCNAPRSGYVVYHTDGYEDLQPQDVTKETFEKKDYEKTQLINNELVAPGDAVYKFVKSEIWSVVIPVTEERAKELQEAEYVQVKFLKTQDVSWASTEIINSGDEFYCILGLNNSVVNFCTERFIDIELITEEEQGLKIPNSAIAEQEFFLIPKTFMSKEAGNDGTFIFVREAYKEDGTLSAEEIELTVYNETETDYYVSDESLRIGDYLISQDSGEKYAVSKKATLIGVYNMNKGYADFRQIIILYQNDEYAIVKSNTEYGLNAYDYIVLDASSVTDDALLYE
ncbi:MAG: hypothetical protein IJA29_00660 [Lachnospiraceae bacterium]|nr:hypothetical protein [Lachnospiraceae bacterium]